MKKPHSTALAFGSSHFVACGILSVVVLVISTGYGLSDSYKSPVWWFVWMDQLLLLVEAPVALVLRLIYHPTARFEPPNLFTIDYAMQSDFRTVLIACLLWSIAFGYFAVLGIRWFKMIRAACKSAAVHRQINGDYTGPRCVSCHEAIEQAEEICKNCGWTQPR